MTHKQWQAFVATRPEANFLQSWQWGELHELLGDTVVRSFVYDGDTIVGGWQGIVKNARRGRYLEVPGGPLINWDDTAQVTAVTNQLRAAAKEHNCVFVRIRAELHDAPQYRATLTQAGFTKAPFHLHAEHTNVLDLGPSEEGLLSAMRRQTRYEVRRGLKKDITVSWSSTPEAIDEFFAVQTDTAQRQGFIPPSQKFLRAQQQAFGDALRVYRAELDGVLLNLALVIHYGEEADYHEAASTPESRSQPGAYALQWQAIRDAKAAGKARYNFWGIAYSDDPKHRYAGVTTFKRGFGGNDVTYVPAHDLIIDRLRYPKNWLIETIRRKRRNL